jgi:hypothetical protein
MLGRLMGELLMKPMLMSAAQKVLLGAQHHLRTKETVGPTTVLPGSGSGGSGKTALLGAVLVGVVAAWYYATHLT